MSFSNVGSLALEATYRAEVVLVLVVITTEEQHLEGLKMNLQFILTRKVQGLLDLLIHSIKHASPLF